ncbi:hypothetical protein STXM2123_2270 [Streptomyces sp. F-3]|nr:hypothetical protein STXM2123_2270 [Streptomyces sp. F-3]
MHHDTTWVNGWENLNGVGGSSTEARAAARAAPARNVRATCPDTPGHRSRATVRKNAPLPPEGERP